MPKTIEINRQDLISLKRSYSVAIKQQRAVFRFKGCDLLVSYAKYLIEFLDERFGIKPPCQSIEFDVKTVEDEK